MFFWFIGTAIVTIGFVFRDPRFDYRLLIVGSVVPLIDGFFGGARALHSVTVSITLLGVVMIATSGRTRIRKMLLGVPIGMFLHLLFDATWTNTDVFWWPFTGVEFTDAPFPVTDRGLLSVVLEIVGLVLCAWLWRTNHLDQASTRARFVRDGVLIAVPDRVG